MKKIITLGFLAVFLAGIVSAADPTGFFVSKSVVVTGDWEWDGDSWENGNFPTTTFGMNDASPLATFASFTQVEALGEPWKYNFESMMTSNADTNTHTELDVWTVNDPATTPATGGYTAYNFMEHSTGDFSDSTLTVSGFGNCFVGSNVEFSGSAWQHTGVDIN